jgi:PPK2 family polyphosphate:nucleotide phosphotransferase
MDPVKRFRVTPGRRFRLKDVDPDDTAGLDKDVALKRLITGVERLAEAQEKLYAQDRWAVLVLLQGMDGSGKDSAIKHVMSGVNPQGVEVRSFKVPSSEELDHDYLWRSHKAAPERGRIGIHNRSYYEEVLVTRVHPEILMSQKLPEESLGKNIWKRRFSEINAFEKFLVDNGTLVLKFFLYMSKDEQRRRFLNRLEEPEKHWKFSPADVRERAFWPQYMAAYEDTIAHTSTEWAPWYVVPADHKWFTRLSIAEIIICALDELKLKYPTVPKSERKDWEKLRQELLNE